MFVHFKTQNTVKKVHDLKIVELMRKTNRFQVHCNLILVSFLRSRIFPQLQLSDHTDKKLINIVVNPWDENCVFISESRDILDICK